MKQREGHRVIFTKESEDRIALERCPTCGTPKAEWKRRRDWRCCSTECTRVFWEEHCLVRSWADLREKVFKRDNHTCRMCGLQPSAYHNRFEAVEGGGWTTVRDELRPGDEDYHYYLSLVADHITPIAVGGDEWDINNVQTLCESCNKIKTARDAGVIARERRREKLVNSGQQLLSEGIINPQSPKTNLWD